MKNFNNEIAFLQNDIVQSQAKLAALIAEKEQYEKMSDIEKWLS